MQEFLIAPSTSRAMWIVALLPLVVVAIVGALMIMSLVASRTARFEVSSDGLRLRGDLYGRFIPAHELRRDGVASVDLATRPDLRPRRRTFGTGLPGYRAGWFRLQNGEKALLYLTDQRRAVYVPTTAGYSVLVSPRNPEAFVEAVRKVAQ
ncbi:MAG: PH domain-containing protein [Acidobacteriota bacterium]|jgi:hypothetical protein